MMQVLQMYKKTNNKNLTVHYSILNFMCNGILMSALNLCNTYSVSTQTKQAGLA